MANETTPVIPAKPVQDRNGGDTIFQAMTGAKKTLHDLGLVKVVLVYLEEGIQRVRVHVVSHSTLDKVANTLEDETIG